LAISVIVPVAKEDEAWRQLLPDLSFLGKDDEVILVSSAAPPENYHGDPALRSLTCSTHWIKSESGRARQLNAGIRSAFHKNLWFLHCDSRVPKESYESLKDALEQTPDALHFFDLRFLDDGPALMFLNNFGVWIRSRILRLPFGDQGFCISRSVLEQLGGFCEKVPYGEDHLLVWRAHQMAVKVRCVGAPIYTSARRYESFGWAETTVNHLKMTARQAAPEIYRLLRKRIAL